MARILIADDEEKIRALVIKYAQFEGHETREARDGLKAVELARRIFLTGRLSRQAWFGNDQSGVI